MDDENYISDDEISTQIKVTYQGSGHDEQHVTNIYLPLFALRLYIVVMMMGGVVCVLLYTTVIMRGELCVCCEVIVMDL